MNRDIGMERLYSLGDFKSIRISDTITGIPEELIGNAEFVGTLRYLQLVQSEKVFHQYVEEFVKNYHLNVSLEDVLQILDQLGQLEINVIRELKDILQQNGEN